MQKLAKCPHCRGLLNISAIALNKASDELLAIYSALPGTMSLALADYIQLFAPDKSDLSITRQLKLTHEVFDLASETDMSVLCNALALTVRHIRQSWQTNGYRKMGDDHNYLKKVLETEHEKFVKTVANKPITSVSQSLEVKAPEPEPLHVTTEKWREQLAKYK